MKQGPQGELAHHLAAFRPGWSLPRPFHRDEAIYRADIEQIWRRGWLFAGHGCEIRNPGDWMTLQVDTDSIIVIRGEDGAVRALHNVCRHRGSQLCRAGARLQQAHRLPVPPVDLRHERRAHLLPRHARHRQVGFFVEDDPL